LEPYVIVVLVVLAVSTVVGLAWQARNGRVRVQESDGSLAGVLAELGATPGDRATLLQFSSAFCAPCRATRTLLAHVAGQHEGVVHVDVDAEKHLDLVRRLGVAKTPTTLILDGQAREVRRAVGAPRQVDVLAALPS
jgi:thiol-disulfide isomerase/thioredoxin